MKAKIRALIILLSVLVLLAVCYVLLPPEKSPASDSTVQKTDSGIMITDIHVTELLALIITNSHGSFGILNEPDNISLISGTEGSFSVSYMRAAVYLACHLPGIRQLDMTPEAVDIANPLAAVSLFLADGSEQSFIILRKSPVGDNYLLYIADNQSVFLVSADNTGLFLAGTEDFPE